MKSINWGLLCLLLISCIPSESELNVNIKNFNYGPDEEQIMDIYLPEPSEKPSPILIIIHGGAWHGGDKANFTDISKQMQQIGLAVFNINYRLGNDRNLYTLSEKMSDINLAVEYILSQKDKWNLESKVSLSGSSAGGHMALLYGFTDGIGDVKTILSYAGPTDISNNFYIENELIYAIYALFDEMPENQLKSELIGASPLHIITKEAPSFLIVHGNQDKIVDFNDSKLLVERAIEIGVDAQLVEVDGVGHDFRGTDWEIVDKELADWTAKHIF